MKRLITLLLIAPTMVFAHPGHLPAEQVHGVLHIEHVLTLLLIVGLVVFNLIRKK